MCILPLLQAGGRNSEVGFVLLCLNGLKIVVITPNNFPKQLSQIPIKFVSTKKYVPMKFVWSNRTATMRSSRPNRR